MKIKNPVIHLIFASSLLPVAALAAGFDCAKSSTTTEKAICSDTQLSSYDEILAATFKKSIVQSMNPEQMKSDQRQWLKTRRNACGADVACLKTAYNERIAELNDTPLRTVDAVSATPILRIPANPSSESSKNIKSRKPVEVTGKIAFGHDAAGGYYWIDGGKNKQYTLGYVFSIDDAIQGQLAKLEEKGVVVTAKGVLKTWKDGSAAFDDSQPIAIFK